MVIDNKKQLVSQKLFNLLFLGLLAIAVVVLFFFNSYTDPVWGKFSLVAFIAISVVYVGLFIWGVFRNYHYLYFSDDSATKLIFRYYSLTPFFKQLRAVEIPKVEFYKASIEKKFLGIQEYLILHQRSTFGFAKYPPISISLLGKKNKEALMKQLEKYRK